MHGTKFNVDSILFKCVKALKYSRLLIAFRMPPSIDTMRGISHMCSDTPSVVANAIP